MKKLPKYRLSLPLSLLCAVLLAGFVTLVALWCQPNSLRAVLLIFLDQLTLVLVNAMPVGLLLLTFAFLFRNVFYGAALTNLIVGLLSVANRMKIQVRDEPLFPRDFALLKELGSILGSYRLHFPVGVIAVVALSSIALAVCGAFVGVKPFPAEKLRGLRGSLLGAAVSFAALAALIAFVLGSDALYARLYCSNPYRLSTVFNEEGFPYGFCRQFTKYLVDRPEGYNRAQAVAWDEAEASGGEGKAVNVVFVMNEAFSDITDDAAFAFPAGDDPLQNLHALQREAHAISGRLVVPGFGGGTANTEFDVLTGMRTNALGDGTTSAMRTVNRSLDSVFRVFAADGYRTSFLHPGYNWFYNRENVYRWFGAESTLFIDDMTDVEYKGTWVTDDYTASLVEEEFERAMSEGRLLFHYATSIQNHMSYTLYKYGEGYDFPAVPLSVDVSDEVRAMADVYTEGVRDADAMLGRLWRYFAARSEPVVFVFYGDHLPFLGADAMGYAALGMDIGRPEGEREDPLCVYETPFVIWANDAAAEALDWDTAAASLGLAENGKLSAAFLGAAVLELTGRGEATAWFSFLNALRRELPVVQTPLCMQPDGALLSPDELAARGLDREILRWRQWSYYKLEQKVIPNG